MSAGFLMYVGKCSLEMKPFQAKGKQRNLHKQSPARGRGACSKHGRAQPTFDGGKWRKCSMKMFKQKQNQVEGATKSWLKREERDLIRRPIAAAHAVDTAGWNVPAASQNHISLVREGSQQPAGSPANSHSSLLVKALRINCPANSG